MRARLLPPALLCALILTAPARADEATPYRLGPPPPAAPRRVVSLAPNLTETVIALGEAARLVGVSRFDDHPAVDGRPRVGGYLDPNLEAILALKPDLVLAEPSPGNRPVVERLARLGVAVRVAPARRIDEVHAMIRAVAGDLGRQEAGAALSRTLAARLDAVRRAAEGLPAPRTLLVYGHEPLVVAAPGSFADELLRLAGGVNVVPPGPVLYPTWPLEQVLASAPEVILDFVIHGGGTPRAAPFQHLPALSAVRVVRLTSEKLMRPGPGLAEGAAELFRALHPEAAHRLEAPR